MNLMTRTLTSNNDTDESRWLKVLARDKASDGEFVYAVRTTGVYCVHHARRGVVNAKMFSSLWLPKMQSGLAFALVCGASRMSM